MPAERGDNENPVERTRDPVDVCASAVQADTAVLKI